LDKFLEWREKKKDARGWVKKKKKGTKGKREKREKRKNRLPGTYTNLEDLQGEKKGDDGEKKRINKPRLGRK